MISTIFGQHKPIPSYRLSVAYEIALVPTPLERPLAGAARVGSVGVGLFSGDDMSAESARGLPSAGFGIGSSSMVPPGKRVATHTSDGTVIEGWIPHLLLVDANDNLTVSLVYEDDDLPAQLRLVALGLNGASCELITQQWDTTEGWLTINTESTLNVTIDTNHVEPRCFNSAIIDDTLTFPISGVGQYQFFSRAKLYQWHG